MPSKDDRSVFAPGLEPSTSAGEMVSLEVHLPERKGRSSFHHSFNMRPMAEVSCRIDNGCTREIVVPVRVGRLLMDGAIKLPQEEESAFRAIHALEAKVAFTMLTEMVSRRDHSTSEVHGKLRSYGFRDEEIEVAVQRACALRFLDDDRFSRTFIETRKRRGWGRRKIEIELRRRGLVAENIPGYPEDFFSEDEDLDRAFDLIANRPLPEKNAFEKLTKRLMGKGFSYSTAAQAARRRIGSEE